MYKELDLIPNELNVYRFKLPNGESIILQFQPTNGKEIGLASICKEDKYQNIVDLGLQPQKSKFHLVYRIIL
jgi:hypothetical protein